MRCAMVIRNFITLFTPSNPQNARRKIPQLKVAFSL